MPDGPPVRGPLPDVAHHVPEPEAVAGELGDGVGAGVAVGLRVLGREGPGPDVAVELALGGPVVAPGEQAVLFARPGKKDNKVLKYYFMTKI